MLAVAQVKRLRSERQAQQSEPYDINDESFQLTHARILAITRQEELYHNLDYNKI